MISAILVSVRRACSPPSGSRDCPGWIGASCHHIPYVAGLVRDGGPGDGDVTRATPSPPASGHSRPRGVLGSKSGVFDAISANIGRIALCSGSWSAFSPTTIPGIASRGAGRQKDNSYHRLPANPPGSSNHKDKSWFALLKRVVLTR
jgi:hypothetical protein